MIIQFNTDKTINGSSEHHDFFKGIISEKLKKYSDHISRIEVHLTDENGPKNGLKDIRCLLEARIEGKPPLAVTQNAESEEEAVLEAIDELLISLKNSMKHLHQN